MEHERAQQLLSLERERTQQLIDDLDEEGRADRAAANQPGDMFDSAEPLAEQGTDDSVAAQLREHMEAIDRAQKRLDAGIYGASIVSGLPIPDDRLEADPTAEVTVDEAR
jgi:DnaK suppressor protein